VNAHQDDHDTAATAEAQTPCPALEELAALLRADFGLVAKLVVVVELETWLWVRNPATNDQTYAVLNGPRVYTFVDLYIGSAVELQLVAQRLAWSLGVRAPLRKSTDSRR